MARKSGKTSVPRLQPKRQSPVISDSVAMRARTRKSAPNPFKLPSFPPGVTPPQASQRMAMDNMAWCTNEWGAGAGWFISGIFEEGLVFPGYANLAGQAQRPEYRKFAEIIATEMTRKWIRITSTSEDAADGENEKISEIVRELDRLRARDMFRKCIELDELFGRSHLYIDTGDTEDRDELKTSLGNGRNEVSRAKVGKGSIKALRPVEPVWVYPIDYTAIDPLRDDWYEPQTWFVLGKQVHSTRLLKFVGREVPDLLKPAYSFGGLSMTQMARPYVDNWLRTRQSVSDLIHSFSVFVLKTNLGTSVMDAGDQLFKRADLFNNMRDNRGLMITDKETEDFTNVSTSIGGLHELQAQSQEQLCSVSSIPTVKFLGIQPTGLNNSDEGGIRMFYDWIAAQQEKRMRSPLTTVIDLVQLSLYGEIDSSIVWHFEPLREMDESQLAELRQKEAQTDIGYLDAGVLAPVEVRKKVAADPDSPYASIDVEDVPDLKEEEEQGLDPRSGKMHGTKPPMPKGMGGEEGEEGEEQDAFPDELEPSVGLPDDEIDEDNNVVELPGRKAVSARRYGTSHGSPIPRAPFEARGKARTGRHETLGSPAFEKAGAERQAAWRRGEGPFHERAAERSENTKDYLKMRIAARESGLLRAAGLSDDEWRDLVGDEAIELAEPEEDWEEIAQDDGKFEESKHPRDKDGKFTSYNTGPNLKKSLAETGFSKIYASKSGKFQYMDGLGNKIVVEPPTGGSKQSSKWTLYTKDGNKIGGETGKNLSSQMAKLGGQPASVKKAVESIVTSPPPSAPPKKNTPAELKQQLEDGLITQEEFDHKVKALTVESEEPPKTTPAEYLSHMKSMMPAFYNAVQAIPSSMDEYHKAKEIIKAAVQNGMNEIDKFLTDEQKNLLEQKAGGVQNVISKAQNYHNKAQEQNKAEAAAKAKENAANAAYNAPPPAHAIATMKELEAGLPSMSSKQREAFTKFLNSKAGDYKHINKDLRNGGEISPGSTADYMQQYLKNSTLAKDITLYRRIGGDYADVMKHNTFEGAVFQDLGFMTGSLDEHKWSAHGNLMMVLSAKKGDQGAPVNQIATKESEQEVMFPAGTKMRVTKYDKAGHKLHVEIVQDDLTEDSNPFGEDDPELDLAQPDEEWEEWNPEDDEGVAEDSTWEESKHPRDADGKFASYNTGPNLKKSMELLGFGKTFKSPNGKFQFVDKDGNKIVVEPPTGGSKQSSEWTLYTKDGNKVSGKTGQNLESKFKSLGFKVPEKTKEAVETAIESLGVTSTPTNAKETKKKKLTAAEQKQADKEAIYNKYPQLKDKFNFIDSEYYYSKSTLKKAKKKMNAMAAAGLSLEEVEKLLGANEKNSLKKNDWYAKNFSEVYDTFKNNYLAGLELKKNKAEAKAAAEAKLAETLKQHGVTDPKDLSKEQIDELFNQHAIGWQQYHELLEVKKKAEFEKVFNEAGKDLDKLTPEQLSTGASLGVISYEDYEKHQAKAEEKKNAAALEAIKGKSMPEIYELVKKGTVPTDLMCKAVHDILKKQYEHQPAATSVQKSALSSYTGSGYTHINGNLHGGGELKPGSSKNLQEFLQSCSLVQDTVLYRKVDSGYAHFLKTSASFKGASFQDVGFGSSSPAPNVWSGSVVMRINAKKGQKAGSIWQYSGHKSEYETLLPAGTRYKVTAWDPKTSTLDVEIIDDDINPNPKGGTKAFPAAVPGEAKPAPGAPPPPAPPGGGANPPPMNAVAGAPAAAETPPAPAGTTASGGTTHKTPLKMGDMEKVGGQLGSNPGGKYKDKQGNEYYIKQGKSKLHVNNELLAGDLFKMAGAGVLDYHPVEGGDHIATKWEKMDKNNVNQFSAEEKKKAQENFAVHAWLANWDAAGLGGDNQSVKDGKVISNDLGGALMYRAQGAPKGTAFGDTVGEWDTLRDPSTNPDNAKLFSGMTQAELKASAEKVYKIPDADIRKAVESNGFGADLADKLIARKNDIAKRAGLV